MRVQRRIDPLFGLEGHGDRSRWFQCPHCSKRLLWTECRKALREKPRCFDCHTLLKGTNPLWCNCGKKWDPKAYHRSVGSRVRLPCPACNSVIRKPESPDSQEGDRQATEEQVLCPKCEGTAHHVGGDIQCAECGYKKRWRDYRKGLKRRQVLCPKCEGTAHHVGGDIQCAECGYKKRWRDYRKGLKRRDERLECPGCGHIFMWQAWRKSAKPLTTGNPQPARDFAESWPKCSTPEKQMMKIDFLLQTLHGQGPLAPLFIEGDKDSIRALLDELASQI